MSRTRIIQYTCWHETGGNNRVEVRWCPANVCTKLGTIGGVVSSQQVDSTSVDDVSLSMDLGTFIDFEDTGSLQVRGKLEVVVLVVDLGRYSNANAILHCRIRALVVVVIIDVNLAKAYARCSFERAIEFIIAYSDTKLASIGGQTI